MISHTGTLFNDGPVRRVVETALRVQHSQGSLDLDDELRRFVRTARAADTSRFPELSGLAPTGSMTALMIFPQPAVLSANVARWIPWVSHDALREVVRMIGDHMRTEHAERPTRGPSP
ncbi:hypothetical protein [Streptomyces sp. Amel2xC10]|uniref:hypothetical protein n=1 Tax=Streptomyces sp. Amel2xC10 TaxID=1305826 RepID=UPI00211A3DD2|nr:hypothetical protein [Streptomyces sp. Amel2xC10]